MISVLDMFTIGIGPSSSHTVGPMRAAGSFVEQLAQAQLLNQTARIVVTLHGSLALTGKGHGVDKAIMLGLEGHSPEEVPVHEIASILERVRSTGRLVLGQSHDIGYKEATGLRFNPKELLPRHSNGMRFEAFDADARWLLTRIYYSVGGGFVLDDKQPEGEEGNFLERTPPYPLPCGDELLRLGRESKRSVSQMTLDNETPFRPESETRAALLRVWQVMQECVERGCHAEGVLPGGLNLRRRAPRLYRELAVRPEAGLRDPLTVMDWISLYAMAVNEENAAGHRVVTAPTNGAAGIIPAVLHYYVFIHGSATEDSIVRFLLTAGAIGILYKMNASISGAEVGCQGEVGVACSMAAAALTEALGGTVPQVEEAAEIGMEHNLGLTCDPVGGLVQVPCIERNAMGAVKAINAARLALHGDGQQRVSLDKVIATMKQTGADMRSQYKETAQGGLAVSVPVC
jgi:L-serine dehydratase